MDEAFVLSVSERYIELYENITGDKFVKSDLSDIQGRIDHNVRNFLNNL
jgi:phosphoribosylaminoimidazole-succinocarboxamide synthase